jgi:hypothetical protein
MKSVAVAAFVLLSAAGLSAQQRQHASQQRPPASQQHQHQGGRPSLPVAPPVPPAPSVRPPVGVTTTPPLPPPSPFAARPWTYAPHYTDPRPSRRYGYGYGSPIYGGGTWFDSSPPAPVAPAPVDQEIASPPPAPQPPKAAAPIAEPPRIAEAHGPDTFYVIPGCYLGNRPPAPERLPKGCDLAKLKTTPIR